MKKFIAFIFAAVLTAGAWAHEYSANVDGVTWYYNRISDGKGGYNAEITYRGYSYSSYSNEYSGSLAIPSTLGGYKVTVIGASAFSDCSSLVSVTIPDSVTTIWENAFYNCSSLVSITISDSVTTIGASAFWGCWSLTSITIPDSVATIGTRAFYYCSSLTSITIPDSVMTIGSYAFCNCWSLEKVHITDLSKWCAISFGNCDANPCYYAHHLYLNGEEIKDFVIPDSVTTIGGYAFRGCSSLRSVTIPDSVTTIGSEAFWGCSSLTSVTIPGKFRLSTIFPDGCAKIISAVIVDGSSTICAYAFSSCSSLISITIPDSVTSIGEGAFCGCSSLTSVTIPNSVTTIGSQAFVDCYSLTSVTIPDSVTEIGSGAFYGTPFYNNQPDGFVVLGKGYLYEYKGVCPSSITIPDSVTMIGSFAFSYCSSLTSITIPDSVTMIGSYAFSYCRSLSSIVLSDSVMSVGSSAFAGVCEEIVLHIALGDTERVSALLGNSSAFTQGQCLIFVEDLVPRPKISPETMSVINPGQTVVLSMNITEAKIYYTIDGSEPSLESKVYTGKFRVNSKCVVKAIAVLDGYDHSQVKIAEYALGQCPNPEIVDEDGKEFLHVGKVVSINYDYEEGVVRYTTDGSDPTTDSPIYEGPIVINDTTTIKTKAFSDRYFDSEVVELALVREWEQLPKVEIAATDDFIGETSVSLSCEDGYAAIYYTLDGTVPTMESIRYTTPFEITEGKTIKAIAMRDDYLNSEIATRVVCQAQVASPVISAADSFQGSKTFVSFECVDGGVVRYTLDGTTPTSASAVYLEPFAVTATTVVTAYATKVGYMDSAASSKTVTKVWCIGDTMGAPDQVFTTEGELGWVDDNGAAMKSGKIADNQESKLRTVVVGEGSLSFEWKVSCEDSGGYYDYDRCELRINGVLSRVIDGIGDWRVVEMEVDGEGEHTVEWVYIKDGEEFDGEDCAWVRNFAWTPKPSRPEAIEGASAEVQAAFDKWIADNGVADPSAANVNAFVLGLEPRATEEAILEKVEEELANLDLGKLAEGDLSAAVEAIQAKYPNAAVELAPVEGLSTSAHLYKLVIKLR